ncbi:hypothetical protein Y032_0154g2980 [Ancylostoma ceylanicum]|uniref:Uncharacterized protein n=1 Tax=Ancylostoma ceylanicum TaxID=53326 RepID=A0A016SZZ4_9BILA|nr:hypothetical protein Y032_0154g2980 [Ancylostoma ceylanicum]
MIIRVFYERPIDSTEGDAKFLWPLTKTSPVQNEQAIYVSDKDRGNDTYRLPCYIVMDRCQTKLISHTDFAGSK